MIQLEQLNSNNLVARIQLVIFEPWTLLTMDRLSSTILQPLFASKDALLVQHEDPSHGAQAEDEKPQYCPASTHTLCVNFPPAFAYRLSLHRLSMCRPSSCRLSSHHPAMNCAEAHSTICPARRFATLRVVVPTLSKVMGVRRLSAHSAYCRPNNSTLLSDRMLRAGFKTSHFKRNPIEKQ